MKSLRTEIEELLTAPAPEPLSVDEALSLENLSDEDTKLLLEIRDMFDGTITVEEYDEESEPSEADKVVEASEDVGPDRWDRGGYKALRQRGGEKAESQVRLWESEGGWESEDLRSGGLRDRKEIGFHVSDRKHDAGSD